METDLQDQHLELLRTQSAEVSVYLVNGLRLAGRISAYDQYGIVLERDGMHQFIFKRAISTVQTLAGSERPTGEESGVKRRSAPPLRGKTVRMSNGLDGSGRVDS